MKNNEAVFISTSEEMTMEFGRFIGEHAENGLFIALIGDLGTGKTHFVQGLAKGLGINDVVSSPTFTIMNYYEGEIPLKHFDFYRLDTEEDLYNIGWEEYSEGGGDQRRRCHRCRMGRHVPGTDSRESHIHIFVK